MEDDERIIRPRTKTHKRVRRTYLWNKERNKKGPERTRVSAQMRKSQDGARPRYFTLCPSHWGENVAGPEHNKLNTSNFRSSRTAFLLKKD